MILRHVQPEVTGKYKCEVSSDAPNFYTIDKAGYMYVVGKYILSNQVKMECLKGWGSFYSNKYSKPNMQR